MAPTPTPSPEHPAHALCNLLSDDLRAHLLKAPWKLPLDDPIYANRLEELRNYWKFSFIVQWFYLFRGIIKLNGEHFDVDSFEEELLQLNPPQFLNKFKSHALQFLIGYKINDSIIDEFGNFNEFNHFLQNLLPQFFLDKYPTDEELIKFNFYQLNLIEQIDIYYELIILCTNHNESLRKIIDSKFIKPSQEARVMPILTLTSNKKSNLREEYFILPDSRLYYKELEFPKLIIPKSRKEFFKKINKSGNPPLSIDEIYNNIEPILKKFKCLATNIYEFDSFISKHSKSSQLYRSLKPHYEKVAENDLKRRRAELSRQKQIKIQNMLQHRKRSSRLEEKQKKRQEDEEIRLKEEEIMRQEAASIRAAKRMKLKENEYLSRENSLGAISREERYKRKQVDYEPEEQGITESETAGNTHVADSATADSAAADISTADLAAATEVQKSSSSTVEAEEPGANDSAIANEITNETANPVVDTVVNAVANPVEIPHTATPPPPVENQEPVIPPVQEETENKQETTQPSLPQLNTTESTTD